MMDVTLINNTYKFNVKLKCMSVVLRADYLVSDVMVDTPFYKVNF